MDKNTLYAIAVILGFGCVGTYYYKTQMTQKAPQADSWQKADPGWDRGMPPPSAPTEPAPEPTPPPAPSEPTPPKVSPPKNPNGPQPRRPNCPGCRPGA